MIRTLIVMLALTGSLLAKPEVKARRQEPVLQHKSFDVAEWHCEYLGKYAGTDQSLFVCYSHLDGSWAVWVNGQ